MDVRGRFYVRALVHGLQLDATSETFLDLEATLREAARCGGVPACTDEVIWRAKAQDMESDDHTLGRPVRAAQFPLETLSEPPRACSED
jgi:hypothetical protein